VAQADEKGIALLALALLVRAIVKLDHANDRKVAFRAEDEVKMLCADAVEGALPAAAIGYGTRTDDIGDAHLPENPVLRANRLLEHTQE
jgi:hypothetical protein